MVDRSSPGSAEYSELADRYQEGLDKCLASGYEEFGPKFIREREMVIRALRAQAAPSQCSAEIVDEAQVYRDPTRVECRCPVCQKLEVHPDDRLIQQLREMATEFAIDNKTDCKQHVCWIAADRLSLAPAQSALDPIELAAWLCALEDAECHKPVRESLIEHGRMYIRAGMTEKHCGDCTNQCHSCVVCGTDGYLLHARQIIEALTHSSTMRVCHDCGKINPCDDDCPNAPISSTEGK